MNLRPCACGGQVEIRAESEGRDETYAVYCTRCNMRFSRFVWRARSEDEVAQEWNSHGRMYRVNVCVPMVVPNPDRITIGNLWAILDALNDKGMDVDKDSIHLLVSDEVMDFDVYCCDVAELATVLEVGKGDLYIRDIEEVEE